MSKDTIYRQAAIDALNSVSNEHCITDFDAISVILDLPSAEPEIIRCKDCKWFGSIGCAIEVVDDSDRPTENDFCSFAERRTEQPGRKKGKWIDMSDGGRIKTLWAEKYKCDKCGMYGTRAWKFCPYCGADMRGEECL